MFTLMAREDLTLDDLCTHLAASPAQETINALFPLLCRTEALPRWRAISCMGWSLGRLAEADLEAARVVMRRFLWSLNDESGGIGWGAPESMAEAMCRHETLAQEYVHMLVSYMREDGEELCQDGNYLEHPLLQRGLLWGIARLSGCRPQLLQGRRAGADVLPYLKAEDAEIRALACKSLGLLRHAAAEPLLLHCGDDETPVTLYEPEGVFLRTTVAALAHSALAELRHAA